MSHFASHGFNAMFSPIFEASLSTLVGRKYNPCLQRLCVNCKVGEMLIWFCWNLCFLICSFLAAQPTWPTPKLGRIGSRKSEKVSHRHVHYHGHDDDDKCAFWPLPCTVYHRTARSFGMKPVNPNWGCWHLWSDWLQLALAAFVS